MIKSLFTTDEKKQAKANYRLSLKNTVQHNQERSALVEHLVKQPFPNWDLKVSLLN